MSESLDELKRLAYGRPDDPDAAARAQQELAALAAPVALLEPPSLPRIRTLPTGVLAALLAAALLLVVLATVIALRPVSSLAVFDRPPTARDLEPPSMVSEATRETEGAGNTYAAGSPRLIGTDGAADIWVWRSGENQVCLGLFNGLNSGSTCTDESTFVFRGIDLGVGGLGVGTETKHVTWGPTGEPVVTVTFSAPR